MQQVPDILRKAKWMWPISHHWDLHHSFALFRTAIQLEQKPETAVLHITADQSYQLYINGEYVCRGPARGYQDEWPYDSLDISRYLRPGNNSFAIRAHHPGFSNFQYISQSFAGVLVAAKIGEQELLSGAAWKGRRQTGIKRDAIPTSMQLFCQEHIDLRVEDPKWMEESFDDSSWNERIVTLAWNARPWTGLQERGIPMLEERLVLPIAVLGAARGTAAADAGATRDVCRTRYQEGLSHRAVQGSGTLIQTEGASPEEFQSLLLDFGRTVVGSLILEVSGAQGGEIIDSAHFERVHPETLVPVYTPDSHSRMAFGCRLICREGPQRHLFYHPFGFRYVVLTIRQSTTPLEIRPSLQTAIYPMEYNGKFYSSEEDLERIWSACAWTQRCCSLDAYVDTPWREQAQWWGDARVQAKNTFFLSGDVRLFRRGLAQIAKQRAGGLTFGHAPTMAHGCVLPDFTLVWMMTLWDYYWQTKSLEPFLAHQEALQEALVYFEENTDDEVGLLRHDALTWLFLDWTDLFREGYSTTYNLLYLIALERVVDLLRIAGRTDPIVERVATRAERLRQALDQCMDEDGVLREGLSYEGKLVEQVSIHAQTLAMLAGFHPEWNEQRLQKILLPFIRGEASTAIQPSCYWVNYVFEVLTTEGYGAEVIDFIRTRWNEMADHGTTWEVFSPSPGEESFSHGWSAHPLYHLMQIVGGVRQDGAGWESIVYQPIVIGEHADVVYPTPLGPIRSRWERKSGMVNLHLTLPSGISARTRIEECEEMLVGTGEERTWKFNERAFGVSQGRDSSLKDG